MTDDIRNCRRCQRPVVVHSEDYSLFESMHWLCFHLEFEHDDFDPDEACTDPSCPWWIIEVYKRAIVDFGGDPTHVISDAISKRCQDH